MLQFFKSLQINNLLSFGPDSPPIELGPLNVIIGANGSGKSNLFDVLALLKNAPGEFDKPIRESGCPLSEWFWKSPDHETKPASIEANIFLSKAEFSPVRHFLSFSGENNIVILDEALGGFKDDATPQTIIPNTNFCDEYTKNYFYGLDNDGDYSIRYEHIKPYPAPKNNAENKSDNAKDERTDIKYVLMQVKLPNNGKINIHDQPPPPEVFIAGGIMLDSTILHSPPTVSVLARYTDRNFYKVLCELSDKYKNIYIYNNWSFGRKSPLRFAQSAYSPNKWLNEDGSNLGVVLKKIKDNSESYARYLDFLRQLYEGVDDFEIVQLDDLISIRLIEGKKRIHAARLSDGTLRYLMLLAVLCDPEPPPVVCIEEPEMGLHPDLIHVMAEALKYAAERTQVIVTTHSVSLVDCFTSTPDVIQVCEKREGQTWIEKLDPEKMSVWLDEYRLGELWTSGEIGGNRW